MIRSQSIFKYNAYALVLSDYRNERQASGAMYNNKTNETNASISSVVVSMFTYHVIYRSSAITAG